MTVREDCLSRYFAVVDEKLEMEKKLSDKDKALEDKDKALADKDKALEDEKNTVRMLREKIDELEKNSGSGPSAGQCSVLPALAEIGRQVKRTADRFSSFCRETIRLIQNLNQEFNV